MNVSVQRFEADRRNVRLRQSGLRDLLRSGTSAAHATLEDTTLMRAFVSGADDLGYARDYLTRQYRLHLSLESTLAAVVPTDVATLRLVKSDWLAEDLRRVDAPISTEAVPMPQVDTWASAVGAMYVVEGSTLGLQKVRRQLLAAGSTGWQVESRFVRGYGEATAARWREFLQLTELLPADQWPVAVAAAQGTFEAFLHAFKDTTHE